MLKTSLRPQMRPAKLDTSPRPDPAVGDAATTATVEIEYDPTAPLLLGTYGADRDRGAILRLPDGAISKVTVGDDLGDEKVLAISETFVTVARKGATRRFTFPGA
ncbi:hypothetical protein [Pseudooceanicola sp.]|uniref:hypothetical protein n=1 Tax=Pseudooceanicola sp. TaxID=1914328 RepID=UPI00405A034B